MTDRVVVGAIGGAFGVKGEVRLKSFCAVPEDIANYTPLFDEKGHEYTVKITRAIKGGFAARLSGIRFKDEADALRGVKLLVARDRLPSLPDDEFYHADLIGLDAFDTGGAPLGKVAAVQNHGAGDIIELRDANGSTLLPFTLANVPTVDLEAGRLVVDLPEDIPESAPPDVGKSI